MTPAAHAAVGHVASFAQAAGLLLAALVVDITKYRSFVHNIARLIIICN